jgi:hypothetical protein
VSVPPSEYRRQALQMIADRSGVPAPIEPVDFQLGPMSPPAQGGGTLVSTTAYDAKPNAAITSDHTGGALDFIRTAIMALQHFAEQTDDDQELAQVQKCIVNLQQIAGHAKDREAALGMTPAMRHVKRATGASY